MNSAPGYLTQSELDSLRKWCERSEHPVPVGMVRRLLADRDEWVARAMPPADEGDGS